MATTNRLSGKFITATKQFPKRQFGHPWNLFSQTQIPYDDAVYAHSFRTGTMPTTVKLYPPILRAAEMLKRTTPLPYAGAPDYLMVSKTASWQDASGSTVRGKEYFLELLWADGSATVMWKKGNDIRISDMESDGTNNPVGEFSAMDEWHLAGIYLLCLPEILHEDQLTYGGKLTDALRDFELSIPEFPLWASEADIPDLAKESAFFMDAVFCYADDKARWLFADPSNTTTPVADMVPDDMTNRGFRGAEVVCSNPNVAFRCPCHAGNHPTGQTHPGHPRCRQPCLQRYVAGRHILRQVHRRQAAGVYPEYAPDDPDLPPRYGDFRIQEHLRS